MKKFLTFFLSLLLILIPVTTNAGFFKKGVKGYVAGKVISKTVKKVAAKRIAAKSAKGFATKNAKLFTKSEKEAVRKAKKENLAQRPVKNGELTVDKYDNLLDKKKYSPHEDYKVTYKDPNDKYIYEAHHIPSAQVLKNHGIDRGDGVAVKLLKERHHNTRTFGGRNNQDLQNESFRKALAEDIKDLRNQFRKPKNGINDAAQKQVNKEVRDASKEIIKQNKERFPELLKREPKK